ncbi:MAG: hypothetical protein QM739_01050 [Propionivibrio sp.]
MKPLPYALVEYHAAGGAQACELPISPYLCEFWPLEEVGRYNSEYQVPELAPGFLGFATSGGGEMLAFSPTGTVVCLPFIGMAPAEALPIAETWQQFVGLLRPVQ